MFPRCKAYPVCRHTITRCVEPPNVVVAGPEDAASSALFGMPQLVAQAGATEMPDSRQSFRMNGPTLLLPCTNPPWLLRDWTNTRITFFRLPRKVAHSNRRGGR